jgi:aspartyl-tRNA synthetase
MQERTHTCGELTAKNLDEVVTLDGFILEEIMVALSSLIFGINMGLHK